MPNETNQNTTRTNRSSATQFPQILDNQSQLLDNGRGLRQLPPKQSLKERILESFQENIMLDPEWGQRRNSKAKQVGAR